MSIKGFPYPQKLCESVGHGRSDKQRDSHRANKCFFTVGSEDRRCLDAIASDPSAKHKQIWRARIIPEGANGCGTVIGQNRDRHRSQEFIDFLDTVAGHLPGDSDVHVIIDNYSTHNTKEVHALLARHLR